MDNLDIVVLVSKHLTSNGILKLSATCKSFIKLFHDFRDLKLLIRHKQIYTQNPGYFMSFKYRQLYHTVNKMPNLINSIPNYDNLELFYEHYSYLLDCDIPPYPSIENLLIWFIKNRNMAGLKESVAWAAGFGHISVLKLLMSMGFPVTTKAYMWASLNDQFFILKFLKDCDMEMEEESNMFN